MRPTQLNQLLPLLSPSDGLMLLAGAAVVVGCFVSFWQDGIAETVVIRANGQVFATLSLRHDRRIEVPGPLGMTEVQIAGGRVRILRDPSPRQYCVRQGWLSRPGQTALCLPNRTAIDIPRRHAPYDSLNF